MTKLGADASRRYLIELCGALAIYAGLLAVRHGVQLDACAPIVRTLLIASPIAPVWAVFLIIWRQYGRLDEFARRRLLESLALSFGSAACALISYSFLTDLGFPKLDLSVGWPVMAGLWIGLTLFFRWRDRPPNHEE